MAVDIPERDYKYIQGLAYKVSVRSFSYIELDDLIQEGVVAYLAQRKKYDPNKNDFFFGFAFKRVYGAMLDYVAKNSVNKYKTVRNITTKSESSIISAPENVEDYHVDTDAEEDLIDMLFREQVMDKFMEYTESLTELEKSVLFSYFVVGDSMVKIAQDYKIARLRIKSILINCVSYLKRRFDKDNITVDLNLVELSRYDIRQSQ